MHLSEEQKFEALKLRYNDHVELLRSMTKLDVQIFIGYITLQLGLGAWLATNRPEDHFARFGTLLIDIVLAAIASKLLYNDYLRRKEVVSIIKNINETLGFDKSGIYLDDKPINVQTVTRPWWKWFLYGIISCVVGIVMVLFGKV